MSKPHFKAWAKKIGIDNVDAFEWMIDEILGSTEAHNFDQINRVYLKIPSEVIEEFCTDEHLLEEKMS